jgi:hypothetical protein
MNAKGYFIGNRFVPKFESVDYLSSGFYVLIKIDKKNNLYYLRSCSTNEIIKEPKENLDIYYIKK